MPKMKSKSSAKKRFSFTATGKVRRNKANHRHIMTDKTRKVKREQRGTTILEGGDARHVRRWLPYG
ncbi:MAG: 50S ribosomal protein L35 [Alphaproteobacteria bacterium]|nr:50S ribosomal protein L35 [Alphaproteobacteria bacterium]